MNKKRLISKGQTKMQLTTFMAWVWVGFGCSQEVYSFLLLRCTWNARKLENLRIINTHNLAKSVGLKRIVLKYIISTFTVTFVMYDVICHCESLLPLWLAESYLAIILLSNYKPMTTTKLESILFCVSFLIPGYYWAFLKKIIV